MSHGSRTLYIGQQFLRRRSALPFYHFVAFQQLRRATFDVLPVKSGDAPKPLTVPVGLTLPPAAGENTGIDLRTWRQRRKDIADYEKHLEKRKAITKQLVKPYFREWTSMQHHQGKTFVSPPALFKASKALFFPNLHGRTLESSAAADTTPVLQSRISVVSMFSSAWGEQQTQTFLEEKHNPEFVAALAEAGEAAQLVRINVEEDRLKYGLLSLFLGSLRKKIAKADWHRYFIIRKGITDEIRQELGAINGKVGYIYLVDEDCRVRWAGCGPSEEAERAGLVKGLKKLIRDARNREATSETPEEMTASQ